MLNGTKRKENNIVIKYTNFKILKNYNNTKKGLEICKSDIADRKSMEANFKSWLNADEYETFKEILKKLYKRLS